MAGELTATVASGTDGVMTNEVGVISGDLELRTRCGDNGALELEITYVGAAEWYTLPGSGTTTLHDPRDHEVVHGLLAAVLQRA